MPLSGLYQQPSEKINSHDMAEFFLAPYKAQVDAMNEVTKRTPHPEQQLPSANPGIDAVRISLIQKLLTDKKQWEVGVMHNRSNQCRSVHCCVSTCLL